MPCAGPESNRLRFPPTSMECCARGSVGMHPTSHHKPRKCMLVISLRAGAFGCSTGQAARPWLLAPGGLAGPVMGWAQQGLACCTTGSDGGDEPRQPTGSVGAVRHGWCVACRVKLGRRRAPGCWHREAWLGLSWGGHSKGWPAAPPAATAATSSGGPPAASGRCGTGGVWRAGLSWAGGAPLVAGTGRPGWACHGVGTARAGLLYCTVLHLFVF